MYHGIVPDDYPIESWLLVKEKNFRSQMEFINSYWEPVSINDYLEGNFRTEKPKAMITFDDGYSNNHNIAYPILREMKIPSTIYVVTDFINTGKLFWFDKVIYTIQRNSLKEVEITFSDGNKKSYKLPEKGKERWAAIDTILSEMKRYDTKQLDRIADKIWKKYTPPEDLADHLQIIDDNQLKTLINSDIVTIGSHTSMHEILTSLSDEEQERTVIKSFQYLEFISGKKVEHFCYPNGNYSAFTISLLERFGIKSAMTVQNTTITGTDFSPYEIPRLSVGAFDSFSYFKSKVTGIQTILKKIKKGMLK